MADGAVARSRDDLRSGRLGGLNVTLVDPVPAIVPPQHDAVQQLSGDRPARDNDPPEVPGSGPGRPLPLSHDIGVGAIVRRRHIRKDPTLKTDQRQTDERDHGHRYADANRGHGVQQNRQNEFWHGGPRQKRTKQAPSPSQFSSTLGQEKFAAFTARLSVFAGLATTLTR
jgi:hypothetical protein